MILMYLIVYIGNAISTPVRTQNDEKKILEKSDHWRDILYSQKYNLRSYAIALKSVLYMILSTCYRTVISLDKLFNTINFESNDR